MRPSLRAVIVVLVLAFLAVPGARAQHAAAQTPAGGTTTLSGYVLPALQNASKVQRAAPDLAAAEQQQIFLSVVLKRTDEAGFQSYLKDVQDAQSANFSHYLSQAEISARFGPSQQEYDAAAAFLTKDGFSIVQGSANRLTLTVKGTRSQTEQAFGTTLGDYTLNGVSFYANATNPALPNAVAATVAGIAGLNNLARPQPGVGDAPAGAQNSSPATTPMALATAYNFAGINNATGAGQKIGLVEFDNYQLSDVQNWAAWVGVPAGRVSQLSRVDVAGGSLASLGGGTTEAMLDIETVMGMAPGANYVVYDAPSGAFPATVGFDAMFNTMINDNATVISNSWFVCESSIVQADLTTVDSILAQAAASGIAVFSASGDTGNACRTSSGLQSGVAHFPADSSFNTVVGGTTLSVNAQTGAYASEAFWNFSSSAQGGFWTSALEPQPVYQAGVVGSSFRSGPDVAASAGNGIGIVLNGQHLCCYNGTSEAAPEWAAGMALVYQTFGHRLGDLNARLYSLAPTSAFHSAASMGSDFTHVGLGSFDLGQLYAALTGTPGCSGMTATAELIQPAAGSTLSQAPQMFCWTQGPGVTSYQLLVGTQGPGSSDLRDTGTLSATTTSANLNIPSQGLIVFARLIWVTSSGTQFTDYRFLETPGSSAPYWGVPSGCWEFAASASTPANTTVAAFVGQVLQTGGSANPVIGVWRTDPATQNEQAGYIAAGGAPLDFSTFGPGNDLELCVSLAAQQVALVPVSAGIPTLAPTHVPFGRFFGTATVNGVAAHNGAVLDVWAGSSFCGTGSVQGGSYYVDIHTFTGCFTPGAALHFTIDNTTAAQTSTVPAVPGGGIPLNLTSTGGSNTLTVNVSGCGSTTPSGSSEQYPGASLSVVATACDGSHAFSGWSISGASCGSGNAVSPCAFTMPNNAVTLTASFTGTVPAITSPVPGATLTGTSQTFQWSTASGVIEYGLYIGQGGAGSSNLDNSGPLQSTVSSLFVNNLPASGSPIYVRLWWLTAGGWQFTDSTYTASGSGPTLSTLTVNSTGGCGSTTYAGSSQQSSGSAIGITATAGSNCSFVSWSLTGASCNDGANVNPCVFTMPHNAVTVTANFSPTGATYALTVNTTGGCGITSPSGSSQHAASTAISITATAGSNCSFVSWSLSGASCNGGTTASPCAFAMPTNAVTVTATFSASGGGNACTLLGTANTALAQITSCTFPGSSASVSWSAGPGTPYYLQVGTSVGDYSYAFLGPLTTTSTTVNGLPASGTVYLTLYSLLNGSYHANAYSMTAGGSGTNALTVTSTGGCGGTTPSGSSQQATGAAISITATAGSNCTFVSWLVSGANCSGGTTTSPCTFAMPNTAVTVTATFSAGGGNACTLVGTANTALAQITNCSISGSSVAVSWSAGNGTPYYLLAGSSPGASNYAYLGPFTSTSTTVNGLPSGKVYLTLYTLLNGSYRANAYAVTLP